MRRWQLVLGTGLACAGLLAVAASSSPPRGGSGYRGETSHDKSISFRVTPQGDLIKRLRVARDLTCRRGKHRTALTGHFRQQMLRIKVGRKGRFHGEARVEGASGSRIRAGKVCIRGIFRENGRVVRGRYREVARLRDGSLCSAGLVTYIARAGG